MIFLKVFFFSHSKIVFLSLFSSHFPICLPLLQNPCAKGIIYFSVYPCFCLLQNLLQLSQNIRGPYFYSIFLAFWFGFCMHMLIMTSAFYLMHNYTISIFSIVAIFLSLLPQTISNNINQLGLVSQ